MTSKRTDKKTKAKRAPSDSKKSAGLKIKTHIRAGSFGAIGTFH